MKTQPNTIYIPSPTFEVALLSHWVQTNHLVLYKHIISWIYYYALISLYLSSCLYSVSRDLLAICLACPKPEMRVKQMRKLGFKNLKRHALRVMLSTSSNITP